MYVRRHRAGKADKVIECRPCLGKNAYPAEVCRVHVIQSLYIFYPIAALSQAGLERWLMCSAARSTLQYKQVNACLSALKIELLLQTADGVAHCLRYKQ